MSVINKIRFLFYFEIDSPVDRLIGVSIGVNIGVKSITQMQVNLEKLMKQDLD